MASGDVRMTRVCAHMTPGQRKAGPWLDGGVLSVWVPVANQSSATHVEQWNDTTARQRSARGDDGSGTCKRPARLDGQLSSVGGSAWWREQAAGNTPSASSHGSVQPRLEGWVHNKGGLQCSPRALDATTRWWNEQRGMAWSRGSRAARSMGSTTTSPLCNSPAPWRSGEAANNTVKTGATSLLAGPVPAPW
jgi:hypothetical protein